MGEIQNSKVGRKKKKLIVRKATKKMLDIFFYDETEPCKPKKKAQAFDIDSRSLAIDRSISRLTPIFQFRTRTGCRI